MVDMYIHCHSHIVYLTCYYYFLGYPSSLLLPFDIPILTSSIFILSSWTFVLAFGSTGAGTGVRGPGCELLSTYRTISYCIVLMIVLTCPACSITYGIDHIISFTMVTQIPIFGNIFFTNDILCKRQYTTYPYWCYGSCEEAKQQGVPHTGYNVSLYCRRCTEVSNLSCTRNGVRMNKLQGDCVARWTNLRKKKKPSPVTAQPYAPPTWYNYPKLVPRFIVILLVSNNFHRVLAFTLYY